MSTTTVTPKNRNTIYKRLIEEFLKGGNDYILKKFFELGKGWDESKKHFQYLYLNMLCNMSCDVEHYFNEMLKNWTKIEVDTKISLNEAIQKGSNYYVSVEKTDNVTLVEAMVQDIKCQINNQECNSIFIKQSDLEGYSGTLNEKINAFITAEGYDVDGEDSDLWIEYEGNPV